MLLLPFDVDLPIVEHNRQHSLSDGSLLVLCERPWVAFTCVVSHHPVQVFLLRNKVALILSDH